MAESAELDQVVILGPKKSKKAAAKKAAVTKGKQHAVEPGDSELPEESQDYSYQDLLKRAYEFLENSGIGSKRLKLPPPILVMKGSKRTRLTNFKAICAALRRPADNILQFIQIEIGNQVSLDGDGSAITMLGKFQPAQVEKILLSYIEQYVACDTCKSCDTVMERDKRLCFVICNTCRSKRSVTQNKQGYRAQVGKRKKTD
jgi:translation initiation factor 2 subunit 2